MALFDLHSHFSFKPANSKRADGGTAPDTDHWRERFKSKADFSRFAAWADKDVVKSSQLNGEAALAGGFRVIVNGLYPLERGFTHRNFNRELATLTGWDSAELENVLERRESYMHYLQREYDNLVAGMARNGADPNGKRYVVVNSYAELLVEHAKPNTLCILNSVEGAHAFADNILDNATPPQPMDVLGAERRHIRRVGHNGAGPFDVYIAQMIANIDRLKSTWAHTPLFVTLAHHYYNHLCGQAPSLTAAVAVLVPQDFRIDHETENRMVRYFDLGLRSWGKRVVAKLLNNTNSSGAAVRRILIDTKHMSPQSRADYYQILDGLKQFQQLTLPIVVSHSAVSGRFNLLDTITHNDSPTGDFDLRPGEADSTRYFYGGVINLFDDEIQRVVDSDGIIGLMIDERRIMGREIPPEAGMNMDRFNFVARQNRAEMARWTDARNAHAWGEMDTPTYTARIAGIEQDMVPLLQELRPAYLSVVLRQLFHIAALTNNRGWDHVALGTDYDGVINPIDVYRQSSDMRTLEHDLVQFWKDRQNDPDAAIRTLYTAQIPVGSTPELLVKKVLLENGMAFLKKYFHDGYLKNGVKG